MEKILNDEEIRYTKAQEKVEEIKGFYGNLVSYIAVNIVLIAINLLVSPAYLWFFWPLLIWGIRVAIHGMKVFNYLPFLGNDWEERKIKEFIEEEKLNKKIGNNLKL